MDEEICGSVRICGAVCGYSGAAVNPFLGRSFVVSSVNHEQWQSPQKPPLTTTAGYPGTAIPMVYG